MEARTPANLAQSRATYLDGKEGPQEGQAWLDQDELRFQAEGAPLRSWKLAEVLDVREVSLETHLDLPPEILDGPKTKLIALEPAFRPVLNSAMSRFGSRTTLSVKRAGRRLGLWSWLIICAATVAAGYYAYSTLLPRLHVFVPPEREAQLGEFVFGAVSDEWTTKNAPLFAAFANRVMDELRDPETPYDLRITLVEQDDLNAMALPGGRVVVFSGLVTASPTPDALAGVLAHELCHVERRHTLKHLLRAIGMLQFASAAVGGGIDGFEIAETFVEASSGLLVLKYSRLAETESDTLAVGKLRKAGRNPGGLIDFFHLIEKEYGDMPGSLGWISTHLLTAKRIERLEALLQDIPVEETGAVTAWMAPEEWAALQAEIGG